jgi:hypothetical protein
MYFLDGDCETDVLKKQKPHNPGTDLRLSELVD